MKEEELIREFEVLVKNNFKYYPFKIKPKNMSKKMLEDGIKLMGVNEK